MLLKKGLLRSTVDELEILSDTGVTHLVFRTYRTYSIDVDEDLVTFVARLEKASLPLLTLMSPSLDEIKQAIRYVALAGVTRPIFLHPLMISNHNAYFKDGVCFEVVRRNKRGDILAAGGRLADLAMVTSSTNVVPLGMTISCPNSPFRKLAPTTFVPLGYKSP
jgi:eukaryotic translation initiation factor 2-alpha kinase 4